ncbi:hypothetical protein Taro_008032 [Colocasia esculenta]|uniref:Uncharacterized protein n=1 Tax=Colocasia esculenta TaxID=4460 RepID=A0A843TVY8_COLES|nr:hypothetical protein [Colocasia esculenta]
MLTQTQRQALAVNPKSMTMVPVAAAAAALGAVTGSAAAAHEVAKGNLAPYDPSGHTGNTAEQKYDVPAAKADLSAAEHSQPTAASALPASYHAETSSEILTSPSS